MFALPSARYAIWFLAIATALAAMNIAAPLFGPIVLALVLGVVLSPFSARIDRLGAPPAASAFLTLLLSLLVVLFLGILIEPVISDVIARGPIIWAELSYSLENVQTMLRGLNDMSEEVEKAINEGEKDAGSMVAESKAAAEGGEKVDVPNVTTALMSAPVYAARAMIFIGTLYFFLLSRREVYAWVAKSGLDLTVEDLLKAESKVSKYFLTITMINGTFGALISVILLALGMPYAILWGFVAFLANYILYLGPAAFAVSLLIGGLVAFDGALSVAPAAIYVTMNMIEGQFVTPSLVGKHMKVSPLLIFISLVFWLWMWGPVGGIIAIPLLVWALALRKSDTLGGQTISSGTPGKLRPKRLAGDTG